MGAMKKVRYIATLTLSSMDDLSTYANVAQIILEPLAYAHRGTNSSLSRQVPGQDQKEFIALINYPHGLQAKKNNLTILSL